MMQAAVGPDHLRSRRRVAAAVVARPRTPGMHARRRFGVSRANAASTQQQFVGRMI